MKTSSLLSSVVVLLLGCGSEAEPPKAPTSTQPVMPQPASRTPTAADDGSQGNIVIDAELAKLCGISNAYFAFDSSSLSQEARASMDALAACFTSGPAQGKSMRVVGHADPRGELEYNLALGQRRAGMVARHVVSRGVSPERVESSSRGELDAVGHDERGWVLDRKVDISLRDDG